MEKLSRVKKFEDLRNSIDTGNDETQSNKVNDSHNRDLENINASLFKKMNLEEEQIHTPEREKVTRVVETENLSNDFQNEYLDDFLNEVKQYNLSKGTRECEDTQIDILHQLQGNNRPSRSHYVEDIHEVKPSIEDMVNTMSNEDIAKEVKSLLNESTAKQPMFEQVVKEQPVYSVPKREPEFTPVFEQMQQPYTPQTQTIQPAYEEPSVPREYLDMPIEKEPILTTDVKNSSTLEEKRENLLHQKLVEETQQLRRQLDEYEDELTDLSDGVEKNNRILNVILCCLIIALLAVIAFVIVMLVKAGGTL